MVIPINFEIEEKLINNPISRFLINFLPFKTSRWFILNCIIHFTIHRNRLLTLKTDIVNYLRIIYPEFNESILKEKAITYVGHYKTKRCDDYILFNLNYKNTLKYINRYVVIHGMVHLKKAMAYNGGIIAVGSHVGSQVLGFSALMHIAHRIRTEMKRSVNIVTAPDIKDFKNIFFRLTELNRESYFDFSFIWTSDRKELDAIKLLNALKKKCILTTNLDVVTGGASQKAFSFFNTFNIRLPSILGAAKLGLLTNSIILPWHNYMDEKGRLHLMIEEHFKPILTWKTKLVDSHPDVVDLSNRLYQLLEQWILDNPEQWIYWDRLDELIIPE